MSLTPMQPTMPMTLPTAARRLRLDRRSVGALAHVDKCAFHLNTPCVARAGTRLLPAAILAAAWWLQRKALIRQAGADTGSVPGLSRSALTHNGGA